MAAEVLLERALSWREVAAIAEGATLALAAPAQQRIRAARVIVEALVDKGIRAYGINTGVGALYNSIIQPVQLRQLSRNIVMSHATGVGPPLERREVRAIIAAAVNNFAHGYSGVRIDVVDALLALLRYDVIPRVPSRGSVGYLSHMAHIALVLLGEGPTLEGGGTHTAHLVLEAKEGLSLVNGTPCATGLMALALARSERLLNWADVIAAMSFENLHGQLEAFDSEALALRASPMLSAVGQRLHSLLEGSAILEARGGSRLQDALSLRAIPHVHGAARDVFAQCTVTADSELAAVTDNPIVTGSPSEPRALSQAHAVGAALGLSADSLANAMAEVAAMAERRLDRLVNPLVSGLPAFLAANDGACSGFMIAQYAAVALVADNRRLAAPASLDGGITSGLQEDHLSHATPAVLKLLKILDNCEYLFAIELLAAAQAYDLQGNGLARAPNTDIVYRTLRRRVAMFRDDRPLATDIELARNLICEPIDSEAAAAVDRDDLSRDVRSVFG